MLSRGRYCWSATVSYYIKETTIYVIVFYKRHSCICCVYNIFIHVFALKFMLVGYCDASGFKAIEVSVSPTAVEFTDVRILRHPNLPTTPFEYLFSFFTTRNFYSDDIAVLTHTFQPLPFSFFLLFFGGSGVYVPYYYTCADELDRDYASTVGGCRGAPPTDSQSIAVSSAQRLYSHRRRPRCVHAHFGLL